MSDHRGHPRIPMACRVKISNPDIGELEVKTRDISDGGIYLLTEELTSLPIGTMVKGQVQGMMDDAPILDMEVVRIEPGGVGLRFSTSEQGSDD